MNERMFIRYVGQVLILAGIVEFHWIPIVGFTLGVNYVFGFIFVSVISCVVGAICITLSQDAGVWYKATP